MTEEEKKQFNELQEKINSKYLEQYLEETGRPTGKGEKFLCILHDDHNPSMFFFRESTDTSKKAFCRSCRKKASIFDFIKYDEGLRTKKEQLQFLKDRYSIDLPQIKKEEIRFSEEEGESEEVKLQEEMFQEDLSQNLDKAREDRYLHQQLAMKHFKDRGLTKKTINEYKLTMTMKFNDTMQGKMKEENEGLSKFIGAGFIFPFIDSEGKYSYIIEEPIRREKPIEGNNPKAKQLEKYYKPRGKSILFNERYLANNDEEIIFVCEGIFDSLSVEEMGFKSIALLTTNQTRFKKLLAKKDYSNKLFILLLDNDSQGMEGEKELSKVLHSLNIKNIKHIENMKNMSLKEWKDSNEYLIKDREGFKNYLEYLMKEGQKVIDMIKEEMKTTEEKKQEELIQKSKEYLENHNAFNRVDSFFQKVESGNFKPSRTGMNNLDEVLGGGLLNQSVVAIGGGSSMGKTTFTLSLALNMIEATKRPIVYFTLEMSEEQIQSKIFSYLSYKKGGMTIPSNNFLKCYDKNVMTDYQKSKVKEALQESKEILENFFIIFPEEGTLEGITKHLKYLKNTCELQGKQSPIVIVDYLQFIQGKQSEDTQSLIKRIQRTFKKYAIDNNSIVFLLIANNRTSTQEKQMSSFSSGRDSSDIEYSCDYNLQMNFSQWEHRGSKKDEQLSSRQELMNQNPRKISITIHKNRLGENGKILDFEFNPIRNTFEPTEEKKEISTTMKL